MNVKRFARALLFCPLLLLLLQTSAWAQSKTVTGTVTDDKNAPVQGASVLVKGSTIGTATDAAGKFSLNVPVSATALEVSYVGFATQEISIVGTTSITVKLSGQNQNNLNEVVVIGYGTARKKDLTGAVASVTAKDFNQGLITAPDQLLQNKVAGLEVTNTSGQPGAAPTIQIRGNSSIRSSNNPLYVVDGVPLDGGTARPSLGNAFGSTPGSNPLLYIDPNTIASIDVLKDASSAAIYGARGANGVIVITTKKGSAGSVKVDVGANYGVYTGYMKKFEILNASEFKEAVSKYKLNSSLVGTANTDALKEITQTGFSQNYSVALSGGNDAGRFRAAFLGSHIPGFLKRTNLDKYLATIGGTYKFLDNHLTLDFNLIAGNYNDQQTSVSNTAGSTGNIISSAVSWNPTQPLITDGLYNFPATGSGNPLAFNEAYDDRSSVNSYLANISASYRIINGLEYKFLYGINHSTGIRKINEAGWLVGFPGLSGVGQAAIGNAQLLSQTFTHTLSYNTAFGKNLTLSSVIGYEYFKTDFSGGSISASGFKTNLDQTQRISIPYTNIFQTALTQQPYSTFANPTAELQSGFGRVTLNYLDRYIITGSLRADGSSRFGKNNRYGYFPAVGVKWNISNESFLKNSNVFSGLGLRASYGVTGNQEFPSGASQEQFYPSSYTTANQSVNGNPDLKWESGKQINAGLDFAFGKGKVFGSFDYYNKNTSDILFQTVAIAPAPSSVSFVNLKNAHLINSGVEGVLGATIISNKSFEWSITGNVAYNKNKVKDFTDPNTGLNLLVQTGQINGQGVSGTVAQVIANNQAVNEYYLKPFLGFDSAGNQKIGAPGSEAFSGDPNPHTILGLSTTLRYEKLTLTINMGGAFGFLIYNNTATSVTNIAGIVQGRNIDKAAFNSQEGVGSGVGASTRFLEKGDYMKLRNLSLRYNFGATTGKYIKNLTAFVSGSNLFVITKFSGFDPEVNIDKSANSYPSRSIEYVPYPTARSITFGVNFSL